MANPDIVTGFRPFGGSQRLTPYTAGGTIYKGDLVKADNTGRLVVAAAGTTALYGVAANYATSGNEVLVWDDPDQQFVGQSDDATEPAALTAMNLNYNIVVATASTLYRRSAMEIDGNTGATDSNLPIKAIRLAPAVDNAYGANAKIVCKINNHALGSGGDVGTLGI